MPGKSREQTLVELNEGANEVSGVMLQSYFPLLYQPRPGLKGRISSIDARLKRDEKQKLTRAERRQLGYDLEDVVLLVFEGLAGLVSVKSYQSAAGQHDLLVAGADAPWDMLCRNICVGGTGRGILVEAKATGAPVGDKEFERLASILAHHMPATVGLGVFVSLSGASGFPKPGGPRVRAVHSARYTQVVVFHSLKKPIIVLRWEDIKTLTKKGSLVTVLAKRVREIEDQSGADLITSKKGTEKDLPPRLKKLSRF